MKILASIFCLLLHVTLYSYEELPDRATTPILTPYFQKIQSKKIRLNNGLEAYIISNPKAKQSGAALSVKVGSWSDPKEIPGMAHFLEHMLFLGTKSHPDEAEFSRFIAQNGGMTNAFTANSQTSFLFTVDTNAMRETINRFSQFFYEPIFNPSGIDRELQAIDQEFAKDQGNDDIRIYYVQKALSRNDHPHSQFHVGNKKTLENISRETLIDWYQTHYSANLMRLIVVSPLPLDTLLTLVEENFEKVPNRSLQENQIVENIFPDELLSSYLFISPIKNKSKLILTWDLPPSLSTEKGANAASILSFILGHEGEKSLLTQLKKEELAENLSTGTFPIGNKAHQFSIEIELTEQGVKNPSAVTHLVFQAISRIREENISNTAFQNIKKLIQLNYQHPNPDPEFSYLMKSAMRIFQEEFSTFPEESLLHSHYDPETIEKIAEFLSPKHALITHLLPEQYLPALNKMEPWLNIPYEVRKIPSNDRMLWEGAKPHASIDLPDENPFIPSDLSLIYSKEEISPHIIPTPSLITKTDTLNLYFAPDTIYGTPKVSYHFQIQTPLVSSADVANVVLAELFIKAVKESYNSMSYPAKMAGYSFDITRSNEAIEVTLDGYTDKSSDLLEQIFTLMATLSPTNAEFELYKSSLAKQYHNAEQESALHTAADILKKVLYENYNREDEKRAALLNLNFETFNEYRSTLFDKIFVKAVIYGNIEAKNAERITRSLLDNFNSKPYLQYKPNLIAQLPETNGPYLFQEKSDAPGNATLLAIQNHPFSFENKAAQKILMQAIKQPFFDTLRTKQQTAYIVFSEAQELSQNLFEFFAVQSNTHSPRDLLSRFEQFIEGYLQELTHQTLSPQEFETIKASLLYIISQSPKSQKEMGATLAKLSFTYNDAFDRIDKQIDAMQNLNYERFIQITKEMLGRENKRRLAILIKGNTLESTPFDYVKIRSLSAFRNLYHYGNPHHENSEIE
ncbi:MAG: insulinase family protein [Waddliaceae bacterium]